MVKSTLQGILVQESGLRSAELLNNRQRRYAYGLLSLPTDHPGHQLLPFTLRDGDQTIVEENRTTQQDMEWATEISLMKRHRNLGQRPAHALTCRIYCGNERRDNGLGLGVLITAHGGEDGTVVG
jgi:hypothetical protein